MRTAYVVTHHWVPNFGANLQAYAIRVALSARGLKPVFVDFRPAELVQKYLHSVSAQQAKAHHDFLEEHLPHTERVSSHAEFLDLCRRCPPDILISGSDAVFRLDSKSSRADLSFPNPYWLTGIDTNSERELQRIALAPSAMGTRFRSLPAQTRSLIVDALFEMDAVSARDSWTESQIKSLGYSGDCPILADPVFTLHPLIMEYVKQSHPSRPYIVLGTQGAKSSEWITRFSRIAASNGYDTVAVPSPEGVIDYGTTRRASLPLTPFDWLRLLAGSSGYVGGRFHPIIVSLAAGNPVVSLDQYHAHCLDKTSSKSWLLMKDFGLEGACFGRRFHWWTSPRRTWELLQKQRDRKMSVSDRVEQNSRDFLGFLDANITSSS